MPFVLPSEHCQGPVFTSPHRKCCIPLFVCSMPLKSQACRSRRYANAEACLLTKGTPVNSSQSRTSNGFCQDETYAPAYYHYMLSIQSLACSGLLYTCRWSPSHTNKWAFSCRQEHMKCHQYGYKNGKGGKNIPTRA